MIKLTNVSVKYEGFTAIENISLEVNKGDWFCITGDNGCGKSSLLKAILGLHKTDGKIEKNISGGIGYVPQFSPVQSDFPASVFEIVLSGHIKKAGLFYSLSQKKNAAEKLEIMGISDIKRACFRELSGGQRQRVLIARALCAGESVLVLDEPMVGLDGESEEKLYATLKDLNDSGVTIIMVSHDYKNVIKYASKIMHIEKNNYFIGTKEQFIKKQEEEK